MAVKEVPSGKRSILAFAGTLQFPGNQSDFIESDEGLSKQIPGRV
jgi:hypothetical protein